MCVDKDLNFGTVIGFSSVTVLWLTRYSLSSSLWPKNRLLKHPPPSLDLAPNGFWLFPEIKSALKGQRFKILKTLRNMMTAQKAILQQEFQKCFQQWQHHWANCVAAEGKHLGAPSQ
jgi:hypothetical protein